MFGLFEKKNCVTDDVVLKLMPAVKGDFEGLRFENDMPQDLYMISTIQFSLRGKSEQDRLVPCRDGVKALLVRIKKGQAEVYYVRSRPFVVECKDRDGALVRSTVKFDVGDPRFANWLQLCVRTPGENVTAENLAAQFDGKALPSWLTVEGSEQIAEPQPEPDPEPVRTGAESLVPGAVVFGRYHIECELGEGGMGKVFLATDAETTIEARRKVVLKVQHIENAHDPKAQEQFKKEAATLAELRDDRIAACYNSRMYGDVPILVMEYVEGVSLDKYLAERDGVLDEAETRELLMPIAEALDYAHRKNIYHLDVKPQNIIVRKTPKMGLKTCLLDFGIARRTHADGSHTRTMSVVGTLQYMSPDQHMNEPPCAAMDVYSLAVTAYECMTGCMPYPDGWKRSVRVAEIAPSTPFARAIMKGISGLPENRPATCALLVNPPIEVLPSPPPPSSPHPRADRAKGDGAGKPPPPPPSPPQPLTALKRTIEIYRMMLAQSANKVANADAERADWMRDRQARLRDLTVDLASVNEGDLADFFRDIRSRIAAMKSTPDDFFAATDRLVELRAGLPKTGGVAWEALKESVS